MASDSYEHFSAIREALRNDAEDIWFKAVPNLSPRGAFCRGFDAGYGHRTPPAATPAAPGEATTLTEEELCLLQRVDDSLGMFAEGRYPYDNNRHPNQRWRRATIADVERHFKRLAPQFTALVVKLFKADPVTLSNPAPVAAPAPASEAVAWNIPDQCPHMIVFDDAEASPLTFAGSGARPAALEAFKRKSIQWNAHLFVRIAHNSRDDTYPDATPGDSVDASVQQAGEQEVIARFLERTGQYVTNDASREAAIAKAVQEALAAREPVMTMFRGGDPMFGKANIKVRWEAGAKNLPDGEHKLYAALTQPTTVQQAGVVEVCFDCDIADCRHIRARRAALKTAPTAVPGDAG